MSGITSDSYFQDYNGLQRFHSDYNQMTPLLKRTHTQPDPYCDDYNNMKQ